jgi:hypothetical protein
MHEIKKYQNLFLAMAQIALRAEGTLSVREQEQRVGPTFDSLVARWFAGDAAMLQIPQFPSCPNTLTSLGSAARVQSVLKATTGTGRQIMDNAALLARCKQIKTEMLSQIANWNYICGYPANHHSYTIPTTGKNRDTAYRELVSMDWRITATRKLLKLLISCRGVQFEHSSSCTDECIRRARISCHFASRGLTRVQQEQAMRSRDSRQQLLVRQINSEADANEELERSEPSTIENRAPAATNAGSRSSFTEQPEPPNYSMEIEHVFRVYGPYAREVSPFFSELWVTHCQAQYSAGRTNAQNVQSQQQRGTVPGAPLPLNPLTHPQLRGGTGAANSRASDTNSQESIELVLSGMRREAENTNYLRARRDRIEQLQIAIQNCRELPGDNTAELNRLRTLSNQLCLADFNLPSAAACVSESAAAICAFSDWSNAVSFFLQLCSACRTRCLVSTACYSSTHFVSTTSRKQHATGSGEFES